MASQADKFGGLVSVPAAIGAAATVAVGFGMRDQVTNEIKTDLDSAEKASELLLESINDGESAIDSADPEIDYRKIEGGMLEMDASFWVKKSAEVKDARSEVLKQYGSKMKELGLLEKEEEE